MLVTLRGPKFISSRMIVIFLKVSPFVVHGYLQVFNIVLKIGEFLNA